MKILIDINHPAHVHYFRNFIKLMEKKGHKFCIINRDSEMINQLLDFYGIEHTIRNKRPKHKGTLMSILNLLWMTLWCIRKSLQFRPDMYLGFGSTACALSSRVFGKPCILLDDTEHNYINHKLYLPNCSAVLTPFYFKKDFNNIGKVKCQKQFRFNGYVEQLYLHSEDYKQSTCVLDELNVKPGEYVVVRYVAYDAHHDLTIKHLSEKERLAIVQMIALSYRVFVSLEQEDKPKEFDSYCLKISPEKMHDLMAGAKFIVTEGATMASEAFVLGVPYLFIGSSLPAGNLDYQCAHYPDMAHRTIDGNEALLVVKRLMNGTSSCRQQRFEIEQNTIRPIKYLEWFVENFPKSKCMEYQFCPDIKRGQNC